MAISVFDLFTVGIGPSSSHTVGPMRAANRFCARLEHDRVFESVVSVKVELYGSLAETGMGHGTDTALLLGLEGECAETVDVAAIADRKKAIATRCRLRLAGRHTIDFNPRRHIQFFHGKRLPMHANGMRFVALDSAGEVLSTQVYYSIGGGFVIDDRAGDEDRLIRPRTSVPHPFRTAGELLRLVRQTRKPIHALVFENELSWRPAEQVKAEILRIWQVMQACVARALHQEGTLPGPLKLTRRAPALRAELLRRGSLGANDPLVALDWVNLYALAVSEENAAGGRVVTAPTNGAAGVIPAVLHYYTRHTEGADVDGVARFLLTAAAIGMLFKEQASISGAEVGCQGEVGVACSMAAGGLVAAFGGSADQVENAAEIGMEHNLGLTCDPVGGLVQIPCIERNAMGAVKAINAARMAQRGDGTHRVFLDRVIETMRQTGADMKSKYKETSKGGLAINAVEC